MKLLDYSLALWKHLQSYLSYKHNTVLNSTIHGCLEPGTLQASREVFTPWSPQQDHAGTVRWQCPGPGGVAADRHGGLADTQSETTMVKQRQSVLPGTPHLQNQGPPSDSSWCVEKIRTKQQLWDWSVLDTAIERLSYRSASKFWGCPCPGPPHWAGLPSPPSQRNVPLLEKTSKSRALFEEICCRDTSHLSWWPPSTQQRPSLFQPSVENMAVGEEGVAATTCPAGAPQLPWQGQLQPQQSWNPERDWSSSTAGDLHPPPKLDVPCPARPRELWDGEDRPGPTGGPASDLWFHVRENVKAGAGAPGMLPIPGRVFLSRACLF